MRSKPMILYSTVLGEGEAEQVIKKSRFIARAAPASSREEAEEFICRIKKEHRDAAHNVPAMVIGDKMQLQWASDDGEPRGTSGVPVLRMLVNERITDVVVVITRYFGGIKLGTGGLVRAYTGAAKAGVEDAGLCDIKEASFIRYRVDYPSYDRIRNFAFDWNVRFTGEIYGSGVEFGLLTDHENANRIKETVAFLSNGKAVILNEEAKKEKIRRSIKDEWRNKTAVACIYRQ